MKRGKCEFAGCRNKATYKTKQWVGEVNLCQKHFDDGYSKFKNFLIGKTEKIGK